MKGIPRDYRIKTKSTRKKWQVQETATVRMDFVLFGQELRKCSVKNLGKESKINQL